ncbi:hypothetical protein MBLNU459_g3095t1 [Dothideomycetes sp. NU459]
MLDIIRDAPVGQLIRFLTSNKVLQYPEERPDFECPHCYTLPDTTSHKLPNGHELPAPRGSSESTSDSVDHEKEGLDDITLGQAEEQTQLTQTTSNESKHTLTPSHTNRSELSHTGSRIALEKPTTQTDPERALEDVVEGPHQEPVAPKKLDDGTILVDWYSTDDPANPQNWSSAKKGVVTMLICLFTTAVYTGSAIYAPSEPGVMQQFGVSATAASLGLALYVCAYGFGPLIFSPISEIPIVGRNPPYMITFAIFVILCVPTALVENFGGLIVLRILQGFFGSPILATGGASLGDIYSMMGVPYALCCWAAAACIGPAMGPIISGFSVTAENWHWSLWEMLWLAGPIWIVLFFFLPETYSDKVLLQRAQRLRKITGNQNLKSQSEINQAQINVSELIKETLIRPIKLIALDPSIAYADMYIALCYGIFYSFFEVFPLVYIDRYGFNYGEMGLTFLSITVGVVIAIAAYYAYLYYVVDPRTRAHGMGTPEQRLVPALFASFLVPAGLFIFAFTGNGRIHWIVSCIGIVLFTVGVFILFQCVFVYLAFSYPMYAGSLFAGNDFARSMIAAAAILFSGPLFRNLGVAGGVSLLGGLTAGCIVGIFVLYFFGALLRARSRFAAKYE